MDALFANVESSALIAYILLFVAAAGFDVWRLKIPNAISAGLVALFAITAAFSPSDVPWLEHVGVCIAVFVAGAVLFRFRLLGGGDVKLVAAASLWMGPGLLAEYAILVGLTGGLLVLALLAVRMFVGRMQMAFPTLISLTLPAALSSGRSVPYGVAIAVGALVLAPALPTLAIFGLL